MKFQCDKCGACCRLLNLFGPAYSSLDRGDGVCKYLDLDTNLCKIYETRPIICNVEQGYKEFFSSIPYEEYINKTMDGCKKLKFIYQQQKEKLV